MIDFNSYANGGITLIKPYQAGKPIEEVKRELGLTDVIKLASNENPFGMSEKAKERFKDPEERRKQSEARKGKFTGKNNPNYGNGYKISGENNPMARKIVCLNDNMAFDTIKKCAEYYKLDIHTIIRNCKGKIKKSRSGLIFMYYDEYLQQQNITI